MMRYNYYNQDNDNWILYLLIILLAVIIIFNISIKTWQVSLEKEYDIKYKEALTAVNEYKENYYSTDEAIDSFLVKLEYIKNDAYSILKSNILSAIVEVILATCTLLPILLMQQVFKINREVSHFHPTQTTTIILNIEIALSLLTCFMDIIGTFEPIKQYTQIFYLVEDIFDGLNSLLDSINFQIYQYQK